MKRKSLFAFLLVCLMCFMTLSSCEFFKNPEEEIQYSEGLDYELTKDGKGYIVTGLGTCQSLKLVIPPSYNGLPVVEIGDRAFFECLKVGYVVLPDTIVTLGEWCFGNSLLAEINIPSSVKRIGNYAFTGTILTKIEISEGVETIGYQAFRACNELESITLPSSVKTIEDEAFMYCKELKTVGIPASVTTIGDKAFRGLSSLVAFEVDENNRYFSSVNGDLYDKSGTKLLYYAQGKGEKNIIIPDGVVSIGDYAFENCVFIKTVTFPETLVSIGAGAFCGDFGIESITLPKSLQTLGPKAFGACKYLSTVYFTGTADEWSAIYKTGIIDTELFRWDWAMQSYRMDCVDAYWDMVPGESYKVIYK